MSDELKAALRREKALMFGLREAYSALVKAETGLIIGKLHAARDTDAWDTVSEALVAVREVLRFDKT